MRACSTVRILHCHSTFSLGGKEARATRLMNRFGDRAVHSVLSAMPDQLGARAAIDPAIRVDFPDESSAPALHGRPGPRRYIRLASYMQQFDLVLTYNWGAMDAVMAHRLLSSRMPLPPLIHHEDGFNADEGERLDWRRNLFRRIALPTAQAVVVPSHLLERVARTVWRQGGRVRRISNGIATAAYRQPAGADAIAGLHRREGEIIVGTIAGLRAVKNLPLLVRALANMPPHVRLVIVGAGPERDVILAEASAQGVADRLLMPGFLDQPHRYVGLFDIMALSSLSEQQPIAVMEGMAAGLPIVAPPVGDVPHMVAASNAPFIVEPTALALAQAVTALSADSVLRARIGGDNRAKAASEFGEDGMIARYAALYGDALGIGPTALL